MGYNLKRKINSDFDKISWDLSRRDFVKTTLLAGAFTSLTSISSCISSGDFHPLSSSQYKLIQRVQDILFPSDELGPGALDLKSDQYFLWVLRDELLDPDENQFLIDGIENLNQYSKAEYSRGFMRLSEDEQEKVIKTLTEKKWGESWLSALLTLIFESMFADPLYASNPNGIGWKWLNHNPGHPRPDPQIIYPNIFNHEL